MSLVRGHQGIVYYAAQGGEGTAADPTLPVGYYENFRKNEVEGVEGVRPAGSRRLVEIQEGMWGVEWGHDIMKMQSAEAAKTYLGYAFAAGAPPTLTWLTVGYGDTRAQWAIQDCKIDTLDISLDNEGWVTGAVSGFGGKISPAVLAEPQTYIDGPGLGVNEAVWSLFELGSLRISYANNLNMHPVIAGPTTTRDPARKWDYMPIGPEDVSGTMGLYNVSGDDMQQPCLTEHDVDLTITEGCDPYSTWVLNIYGMKYTGEQMTIPGADADIEWEVPFLAKYMTLT